MGGSNRERGAGRREKARVIMREQDVLRYGEEAKEWWMHGDGWMCVSMEEQPSALAPPLFIIPASGFVSCTFFLKILSLASTMCGFSFL